MRSVQASRPGAPEVLELVEQPDPVVSAGKILIDVEVAGVILMDTWFRAGTMPAAMPFTPGFEVGGRVLAVGADGDATLVGRRVVAGTGGSGGYADRALVAADEVFAIPGGLSTDAAVGVFQSGRTAVGLIRAATIEPGAAVLVTAAAGSTGSLLVQLAAAAGAGTVIAAASGGKESLLKRLGVDVVVDYTRPGWAEQVTRATGGKGVDVTLESVGGAVGKQAWLATGRGGRFVAYGWASGQGASITTDEIAMRGVTLISGLGIPQPPQTRRKDAEHALAEAAAGRLVAEIGGRFPLEEAARAHFLIAARRNTGKLLLVA